MAGPEKTVTHTTLNSIVFYSAHGDQQEDHQPGVIEGRSITLGRGGEEVNGYHMNDGGHASGSG